MLLLRGAVRTLSSSCHLQAAATGDKSKLAKLRKLTGYSFVNCKKALEKHDYNVEEAEKWLRAQAQAEGWAKATKLGGRATPQGLVCVATHARSAAMVEINCETDFVSRNAVFDKLVRSAAADCLLIADRQPDNSIAQQQLDQVSDETGRGLPDRLALAIGQVGENMTLGRAVVARAGPTAHLATYVHPGQERGAVQTGRYGAIVLFEMFESGKNVLSPPLFGRNLCQHVVGMAPRSLGDPRPPTEEGSTAAPPEGSGSSSSEEESETRLLDQEFLVDPEVTVREYLAEHNAQIIDFVRMECGENLSGDG